MAWNGSDNAKVKVRGEGEQRKVRPSSVTPHSSPLSPSLRRGIVAGLVVVIGAIAAWLVLGRTGTSAINDVNDKSSKISNVKAAKLGVAEELTASNAAAMHEKISKPKVEAATAFLKPKIEGRLVVWKRRDPPPVFTNQFESCVADVLTMTPGERFLTADLDETFDESFEESLKNGIVINKDDPEEVAELKRAVIEAREEMRTNVRNGQKPSEIVMAAMKEMNDIADYRDQLQEAFNAILLTETDPKKVVEHEKEANALLDEYGALHIEGPHDKETAYDMIVGAKEEKIEELSTKLEKENEQ